MILLGEMRDLETIGTALTAAETGHLVFATLHTQDAPSTVDRLIDVFPGRPAGADPRPDRLARSRGSSRRRCSRPIDGNGRVAALEILLPDDAVRNLIRQAKVEQIYSVMQTNTSRGMQTLEQAMLELVRTRKITAEIAAPALEPARPAEGPARSATASSPRRRARAPAATCGWPEARERLWRSKIVGLKLGASRLNAACVSRERLRRGRPARGRAACRPASSPAARCARSRLSARR